MAKVTQTVQRFDTWLPGDTLGPWDLRPWRDRTYIQYRRFWTEAAARGLSRKINPKQERRAFRMKQRIDGPEGAGDLFVEARTVSELTDDEVLFMLRLTSRRWEMLNFLIGWLLSVEPGDGLRRLWSKAISAAGI